MRDDPVNMGKKMVPNDHFRAMFDIFELWNNKAPYTHEIKRQ